MTKARFSIRTAIAEGFEFWRQHWRKAAGPLSLAVASYLAYVTALTAQPTIGLLALLGYFVSHLVARTAFYRIAMAGQGGVSPADNGPAGLQWKRLETQFVGVALLKLALFLVASVIAAFLLATLMAGMFTSPPTTTPETLDDFMALLSPTGRLVFGIAVLATVAGFLVLWARLSMAEPATVATGRVQVFSSLKTTKGLATALIGLRLLIQAPVLLLQLAGLQLGVIVGDPATGAVAQVVVGVMGIVFMVAIEVGALAHVHRELGRQAGTAA